MRINKTKLELVYEAGDKKIFFSERRRKDAIFHTKESVTFFLNNNETVFFSLNNKNIRYFRVEEL